MSQHRAIDLTGKAPRPLTYKRKLTASDRFGIRQSEKAIDSLLSNRLNAMKHEKSESSMKIEPVSEETTQVPEVEWWDAALLNDTSLITHLVEHPVPLRGSKGASKPTMTAKAFLTPAERDKLRHLKKVEKELDMQNQIKLGLLKPPPPRIKLRNVMRVLGEESVAGPSAVEQAARAQAEQRLQEHEQRNAENKLSPQERREKNIAKWTKPLQYTDILQISVYAIFCLVGGRERFKICKNAEQLHLGGLFVDSKIPDRPSLVVVEGTRRGTNRFNRLMLRRIHWSVTTEVKPESDSDESDDDEDITSSSNNLCVRIFKGTDSKKKFSKWTYIGVKNFDETTLRAIEEKGCMHYWDMLARYRSSTLDI